MSLQQCNKVCANIEQNFSVAEQTRARANIGFISPIAGFQSVLYETTHIITADDIQYNRVIFSGIQLPDIIRNATGKSFLTEAIIHIAEAPGDYYSNNKINGDHTVRMELYISGQSSGVPEGRSITLMSDVGGAVTSTIATTIGFEVPSTSLLSTYDLYVWADEDTLIQDARLWITIGVRYVQEL